MNHKHFDTTQVHRSISPYYRNCVDIDRNIDISYAHCIDISILPGDATTLDSRSQFPVRADQKADYVAHDHVTSSFLMSFY